MLISLIKCINGNETRYKYLPLEYCCDKMRLNPMLNLTSECDENNYVFCDEGEKINISVVGEVDITNLVKELENKYIATREKYDNCDSIKQRKALYEEMKKADNEYEDVFRFGEFKYNIKDVKWHGNS